MKVIESDPNAPKDSPWWFVLWDRAADLNTIDERIRLPPTVHVPYLLHEDVAAGINVTTYPYVRGLRELMLGLLVVTVRPEDQNGYRITDRDRRDLLEFCAGELRFASIDAAATMAANALGVWYDVKLVFRVARCVAHLGIEHPLLRGETCVQYWFDLARSGRRDAAPFHDIDRVLAAIPAHVLAGGGAPPVVGCSLNAARVTGGVRELERRAELHAATLKAEPVLQKFQAYLRDRWQPGDAIPWPLDGRYGFDTEAIRSNPPGIARGPLS